MNLFLSIKPLKIAAAQFEHRSLDKEYNLSVIDSMSAEAELRAQMRFPFTNAALPVIRWLKHLTWIRCWSWLNLSTAGHQSGGFPVYPQRMGSRFWPAFLKEITRTGSTIPTFAWMRAVGGTSPKAATVHSSRAQCRRFPYPF